MPKQVRRDSMTSVVGYIRIDYIKIRVFQRYLDQFIFIKRFTNKKLCLEDFIILSINKNRINKLTDFLKLAFPSRSRLNNMAKLLIDKTF